jgi:hypothetical protein
MSEMVARTGTPPGLAEDVPEGDRVGAGWKPSRPSGNALLQLFRGIAGGAMPDRSPLTSAMNTGTPPAEKALGQDCRVTVLPVPVAPVIRPWRLAICGSRAGSSSDLAGTGVRT